MISKVNDATRLFAIDKLLDEANIYLVFSKDTGRSTLEEPTGRESTDVIHGGTTTMKYAVRLHGGVEDSNLHYAISTDYYMGGTKVTINNEEYSIEALGTMEEELWTNLYFNVTIEPASALDYNVVAVVAGITGGDFNTPENIITEFTGMVLDNATIILLSLPADTTISSAQEFPGLIKF